MISSSLTVIFFLLPLIAAQKTDSASYSVDPSSIIDPVDTYTLGPGVSYTDGPIPTYTPTPEPDLTYITVTYTEEPVTSTYTEEPPIITDPACNPEAGDCPPCSPEEGECPYPVTSTTAPAISPPIPSPTPCFCTSAPCPPCNGTPVPYPQTIYTTVLLTVTSCPASLPSCSPGHITTSLISLSTIPSPSVIPVYTTVYTTAYIDICPTGLTTKTYTLTQTCTEEKCLAPTTLPAGFTRTEKVCEQCDGKPTVTVTCPVEMKTGAWGDGTETGTGKPSGSKTGAGGVATSTGTGKGCGSGGLCPSGKENNGTAPIEASGAESTFAGGIRVLAICGLIGLLAFMF